MNNSDSENRDMKTAQQARQALDNSLEELSPEVLQQLQLARERALQASTGKSNIFRFPDSRVVWGGAMVAALAVVALTGILRTNPEMVPMTDAESFLALAELDETEWQLLQDELEFAFWLSGLAEEELAQENPG